MVPPKLPSHYYYWVCQYPLQMEESNDPTICLELPLEEGTAHNDAGQ